MKGSDDLQVQDILAKDLVGDEWLTEDELRFLMSVTDEEQLQLIYKKAYEVKAKYVSWTEEPGRLQSMGSLRVGHD